MSGKSNRPSQLCDSVRCPRQPYHEAPSTVIITPKLRELAALHILSYVVRCKEPASI